MADKYLTSWKFHVNTLSSLRNWLTHHFPAEPPVLGGWRGGRTLNLPPMPGSFLWGIRPAAPRIESQRCHPRARRP